MAVTLALSFAAGLLSILSPCVLPLLPIILAGATAQGRFGVVWLAAGLAVSFTFIGLFVATIGYSIGLDTEIFRNIGALIMIAIGVMLAVPALQMRVAVAAGPVSDWTERRFGGFSTGGSAGQFSLGLLLGAVWGPCVGPTLGAASIMAAQGENLGIVAVTMLVFGVGAGIPLLALGSLSRARFMAIRDRLKSTGTGAKSALGAILALMGMFVLTGYDKKIETILVNQYPEWLTRLTTAF